MIPMITKKPIPSTFAVLTKLCPINPGKPATIPANMMSEIPFPIPRSVINSPNQMRNIVPATIDTKAAKMAIPMVDPSKMLLCLSKVIWPKPCATAIGTVSQWVILFILALPDSPSLEICCNLS